MTFTPKHHSTNWRHYCLGQLTFVRLTLDQLTFDQQAYFISPNIGNCYFFFLMIGTQSKRFYWNIQVKTKYSHISLSSHFVIIRPFAAEINGSKFNFQNNITWIHVIVLVGSWYWINWILFETFSPSLQNCWTLLHNKVWLIN